MADFIWVDEASRCFEFTDGEDVLFFSDKPALKLGQQFTGTSVETPLTLLFSRLNAVNAAIFPVNRRWRRYFSVLTPLFFRLNAVNAASFPLKRR